jgi:hypothetical protein
MGWSSWRGSGRDSSCDSFHSKIGGKGMMKPLKCDRCSLYINELSQGLLEWISPEPPGGFPRMAPREKFEPMKLSLVHSNACSSVEARKISLAEVLDHVGCITNVGLKFIVDAGLHEGGVPAGRERYSGAHDALKMILRLVSQNKE